MGNRRDWQEAAKRAGGWRPLPWLMSAGVAGLIAVLPLAIAAGGAGPWLVAYQWFLLALILAGLGWTYAPFLPGLGRYLLDHPGQGCVLLLLYLMTWGHVGTGLGLSNLIWHENVMDRAGAALAATLLLASLGVNAHYNTRESDGHEEEGTAPEQAARTDARYAEIAGFLERWGLPWPRVRMLDAKHAHGVQVSWLLRAGRLPFLMLLSLPALLPSLFPYVPSGPPLVDHAGNVRPSLIEWAGPPWAHLLGAMAWFAGVLAGILAVKLMIRFLSEAYTVQAYFGRRPDKGIYGYFMLAVATFFLLLCWQGAIQAWPSAISIFFLLAVGGLVDLAFARRLVLAVKVVVRVLMAACLVILMGTLYEEPGRVAIAALASLVLLVPMQGLALWPTPSGRLSRWSLGGLAAVLGVIAAWARPDLASIVLAGAVALLSLPLMGRRAEAATTEVHSRDRYILVLAVAAWILLVNHDDFKERFDRLDYSPEAIVEVDQALQDHYRKSLWRQTTDAGTYPPEGPGGGLLNRQVLDAWHGRLAGLHGAKPERPKLVIVCVSGGAIRSAFWSSVVVDQLAGAVSRDHAPGCDFHRHVRLITGASGGMVGMSYYMRWLYERDGGASRPPEGEGQGAEPDGWYYPIGEGWSQAIPRDSLEAVARFIALESAPRMLLPRAGFPFTANDRGSVLEHQWRGLGISFRRLRPAERDGAIPSIIFSPMIVDDGRRLLISNLNLMTYDRHDSPGTVESEWPIPVILSNDLDDDNDAHLRNLVSISGIELLRMIPGSDRLDLATAARMSATFPFVSPAVSLPTDPPLRIVDAGYYDNYGVHLATNWIVQNKQWLQANTSGVLVLQIRDATSKRDRSGVPGANPGFASRLANGFQFFSSVADAISRARTSTMSFRNDHDLLMVNELFQADGAVEEPFVATVVFENTARVAPGALESEVFERVERDGRIFYRDRIDDRWPGLEPPPRYAPPTTSVPMNWMISRSEYRAMRRAFPALGPTVYDQLLERWKRLRDEAGPRQIMEGVELSAWEARNQRVLEAMYRLRGPDDRFSRQKVVELQGKLWGMADESKLDDWDRRFLRLVHISWLNNRAGLGLTEGEDPAAAEYYAREFDRAMNFERLEAVRRWWQGDYGANEGADRE